MCKIHRPCTVKYTLYSDNSIVVGLSMGSIKTLQITSSFPDPAVIKKPVDE